VSGNHYPCPCGAELADECPRCAQHNPFGSMRLTYTTQEPCFYCRRGMHDSCISGEIPCLCCVEWEGDA
jgi:hypothetical protein